MRLSYLSAGLIIGSSLVVSSCVKEFDIKGQIKETAGSNTFYGPQEQVGDGHARTFATISHSGVPVEVGVILDDKALNGLPTQNTLYVLDFHNKAKEATLFEHVALGLSAHGHGLQPSGSIEAHLDVRFFMMTQEERQSIPAPATTGTGPAGGGFDVLPPAGYLPSGYAWNYPVAQIGRHWSDNIFTAGVHVDHTMIYGTWNGQLNFIAPIVTLETLESGQASHVAYPQPKLFAEQGYYATKYNIYKDEKGRHYVSLSDFVWR